MRARFFLLHIACFFSVGTNLLGQEDFVDPVISVEFLDVSLVEAINQVALVSGISIVYQKRHFSSYPSVTASYQNQPVLSILKELIDTREIQISASRNIIVLSKKEQLRKFYGFIIDEDSGEHLPFATIFCRENSKGYYANDQGYFVIQLEKGQYNFEISFLGHHQSLLVIDIEKDVNKDVYLAPANVLPEVVVDEQKSESVQHSHHSYSYDQLMHLSKTTPGVGGGSDLLQTAKALPGIQSGPGGIGGYFVRGGGNQENLYLLDGVAVYNPFHTFGMTSIFSPQATKSLQIYKAGFRAHHGDRSSSVIDVKLREGNLNRHSFLAGVNPQDAHLVLDGPISKGRSSLFLYGRTSTINYKFKDVVSNSLFDDDFHSEAIRYHDLIGKFNYKINPKNRVYASFYDGQDNIKTELEIESEMIPDQEDFLASEEYYLSWGNQIFNLRWHSILSNTSFLETSINTNGYYSDFAFFIEDESDDYYYVNLGSQNRDTEFKISLDVSLSGDLRIKTGGGGLFRRNSPSIENFTDESYEFDEEEELNVNSFEGLIRENILRSRKIFHFLEGTLEKGRFGLQAGLRSTYYNIDETSFIDLQPRINAGYRFGSGNKVSFSISRAVQYLHLLSVSDVNYPRDIWYPSNESMAPQRTWHANLAHEMQINPDVKLLSEIYLKHSDNVVFTSLFEFSGSKPLASLFIESGTARSIGAELNLSVDKRNWQGLFSSGLGHSNRSFEQQNLGVPFSFQFDRLLEFKTSNSFKISKFITLGINTYLSSGHPYLIVDEVDLNQGILPMSFDENGRKNTSRTGWNHRIDFSLLYSRSAGKLTHDIKLNLYNAYNQSQPLFHMIDFSASDPNLIPSFSIPLIPSISYTASF